MKEDKNVEKKTERVFIYTDKKTGDYKYMSSYKVSESEDVEQLIKNYNEKDPAQNVVEVKDPLIKQALLAKIKIDTESKYEIEDAIRNCQNAFDNIRYFAQNMGE